MKAPRFSGVMRLSQLMAKAEAVARARSLAASHKAAETACLAGMALLLLAARHYH